jgi:protein gp37
MAKNSNIEWTDHTFNGWRGCTKVSPGCANCYAEKLVTQRLKGEWGPGRPRQLAKDAMWREPLKWDREAAARIESLRPGMSRVDVPLARPRVFCSSLADWLDHEVPTAWRVRLFALIEATPHLDWLLLTKRPQSWNARLLEAAAAGSELARRWVNGEAPANVWLGTSVEDQTRADERIPELLRIPARVRFLSMEPLLGPVKLFGEGWLRHNHAGRQSGGSAIDWVIVGGESGGKCRPMNAAWVREIRDRCRLLRVPFFFKQWGGFQKKKNGRELDGRTWDEMPRAAIG